MKTLVIVILFIVLGVGSVSAQGSNRNDAGERKSNADAATRAINQEGLARRICELHQKKVVLMSGHIETMTNILKRVENKLAEFVDQDTTRVSGLIEVAGGKVNLANQAVRDLNRVTCDPENRLLLADGWKNTASLARTARQAVVDVVKGLGVLLGEKV